MDHRDLGWEGKFTQTKSDWLCWRVKWYGFLKNMIFSVHQLYLLHKPAPCFLSSAYKRIYMHSYIYHVLHHWTFTEQPLYSWSHIIRKQTTCDLHVFNTCLRLDGELTNTHQIPSELNRRFENPGNRLHSRSPVWDQIKDRNSPKARDQKWEQQIWMKI